MIDLVCECFSVHRLQLFVIALLPCVFILFFFIFAAAELVCCVDIAQTQLL